MVKVTVIVPIYNVAKYLRECLDSLVRQSLDDIEVLLIDDGSTDECPDICDRYVQNYSNFRVIHQKNMGLSGARNTGIANSYGKWIMIVDGDDWVEDNCVELLYRIAEERVCDICIGSYFSNYPDKEIKDSFFTVESFDYVQSQMIELQKNCLCYTEIGNKCASTNMGVTWARLYKSDFLKKNNLSFIVGLKRMQDAIFHLSALEYAQRVSFKDIPVYHYRVWNDSASQKYSTDFDNTALEIADEIQKFINKYNKKDFDEVYYTKCVKLLMDIVKLKYAKKCNKMPLLQKIKEIRRLANLEIYSKAIGFANPNLMTKNQGIGVRLLRARQYFILYFLYRFCN